MDGNFQASFIPKKPLNGVQEAAPHAHVSIFSVLAVFLFIVSIGLAGGAYFWAHLLESQKEKNRMTLEESTKAFDPNLIDELKRVNTRMDVAKELMDKHVALSNFFDVIEEFTLKSVRFDTFSYTFDDTGAIKLLMNGEAESFSAIALQSDELSKNKKLSNPILTNLALADDGRITFTLNADVPPAVILYKDFIKTQPSTLIETSTAGVATSTPEDAIVPGNPMNTR